MAHVIQSERIIIFSAKRTWWKRTTCKTKRTVLFLKRPIIPLKKGTILSKFGTFRKLNEIKKYNLIVVNNRSLEFRKILKDYTDKNKVFLFDSRRFFDKKKFKNYSGSGI